MKDTSDSLCINMEQSLRYSVTTGESSGLGPSLQQIFHSLGGIQALTKLGGLLSDRRNKGC